MSRSSLCPSNHQLGEATGLLVRAKARRRQKTRAKGESKGLLDSAGIKVKDPKVRGDLIRRGVREAVVQGAVVACSLFCVDLRARFTCCLSCSAWYVLLMLA